MSTKKQTIAITGAYGTLGLAVARHFAAAGTRLALIDHAPTPSVVEREFAGHLVQGGIDLTTSADAERAFDSIRTHFGSLDGLVNIAGGFKWEPLAGGSLDSWDRMFAMNLKTAVCASRAALPLLLESGAGGIVNIGALAATKAAVGMGPYASSKAGVARFTESLAEELKDRSVRVNAVLPSIVDTPQNRRDMPDADFTRWVAPEAIAPIISFLMSSGSAAITGALIPVTNRC